MTPFFVLFCFYFVLSSSAFSQFIFPVDANQNLSSNYGEFREDHFHMGIDIKTNGMEGYKVYAIEDGFISRMVTNFTGYGKALYLETHTGIIAVYCHLSQFSNELESELHSQQIKLNSYLTNTYYNPTKFVFKKGDLLGYTGNTGASFGPHLHFELRNSNGATLNPQLYGINIADVLPPSLKGLTIFPLTSETKINGFPLPREFPLNPIQTGFYTISDSIICTGGRVGFALNYEDRHFTNSHRFQFYRAHIFINDSLIFEFAYDSLSFEQSQEMNSMENREYGNEDGLFYHKLFLNKNSLLFQNNNLHGRISLSPGIHSLRILVTDAVGNKSEVNSEIYWEGQYKNRRTHPRLWKDPQDNNSVFISQKPLRILHSQKGVYLEFQTSDKTLSLKNGILNTVENSIPFELFFAPPNMYYSSLIPFGKLENVLSISIDSEDGPHNFPINSILVYPKNSSKLKFNNNDLTIHFPDSTFYDTAFVWIEKISHSSLETGHKTIGDMISIAPETLPLRTPVTVTFNFKQNPEIKLGIYQLNHKKRKWVFMKPEPNQFGMPSAKLYNLGVVSMLQDTVPPKIVRVFPEPFMTVSSDDLLTIECFLDDNLSGIEPTEDALQLTLNGKRVFPAFQPILEKLSYSLQESMRIGKHSIHIVARDYFGNTLEKTIYFYVN